MFYTTFPKIATRTYIMTRIKVSNFNELKTAIDYGAQYIIITRSFLSLQSITLPPSVQLLGQAQENGAFPSISFSHSDGFAITCNNHIHNLVIQAPSEHRAIYNITADEHLGTFEFSNLTLSGQFSFIARSGVKNARINVNNLDIIAANTCHYLEQPQKYGVNVLQGAFTVYNFNSDADSLIELNIEGLTIGRENAPVIGSGMFISGFGDQGGRVLSNKIITQAVYSNGKIPYGVANLITAAIFVVYGAEVKELVHEGDIVTYGVNDMVLDTWGSVENWLIKRNVISYGPSGVGFVNFGYVKKFIVEGAVETYGLGARGYNQYDGTVDHIEFQSITTYGDGSVGIQISKKIGKLTVHGDVHTHGGIGNSLVKGLNVTLPAIPLSIKEGGDVEEINIGGNIESNGNDIVSYQVDTGIVRAFNLKGKVLATGKNSQTVVILNGGQTPEII